MKLYSVNRHGLARSTSTQHQAVRVVKVCTTAISHVYIQHCVSHTRNSGSSLSRLAAVILAMPMPLGRCAAVCSRRNGLLAVLTISTIIILLALPCTLALSRHLVEKTPSSLPTLSSSQQQQQQQPSSPIDALQQYVDQDDGYYHYEHLADHTMSG